MGCVVEARSVGRCRRPSLRSVPYVTESLILLCKYSEKFSDAPAFVKKTFLMLDKLPPGVPLTRVSRSVRTAQLLQIPAALPPKCGELCVWKHSRESLAYV